MKLYDKKNDLRLLLVFFIFFFIIWFYILAYLSTISIFLLIISLILIIDFLFKGNIVCLFIPLIIMLIYFLLFNFLPSKECGFNDWKLYEQLENIQSCNHCVGVIKYTDSWMKMECIGTIIK